jgi:hypothetical protein
VLRHGTTFIPRAIVKSFWSYRTKSSLLNDKQYF